MLLECFGSAVIGFKGADVAVAGYIHDPENIGAVMQGGRNKASAQAVTREQARSETSGLYPFLHNLSHGSI
jgi:hypothetical protein